MELLKTCGTRIVNEKNEEILLQGFGLGGWLLPEGYMWKLYTKCDRPRRMEKLIEELCGPAYAESFWERYLDSYITRTDIAFIAQKGFNSIRLPLNARTLFNEETQSFYPGMIARIDKLIEWCREFGIYVILDMHGAPGGQTGTNIDDSENDMPELFTVQKHREDLILLWSLLARRYKDENCIAGYDLLNEPLPNWFGSYNGLVLPLYKDLAKAIRQVDTRHMLILEGVHWATDFEIFDELESGEFDGNYMLQFHKYWSTPDIESIQKYVDCANKLNVPLFMGEGGENNLDWYAGFFNMLTGHGISYSFWSYKKMKCYNSPVTFEIPGGWDRLIEYMDNRAKLSLPEACDIFDGFIKEINRSVINNDVINAIRRQIPVSIPAEYFDEGCSVSRREKGAEIRMTEGITILFENGKTGVPDYRRYGGEVQPDTELVAVKLLGGEWVRYDFEVPEEGKYQIQVHCRAREDNTLAYIVTDRGISADIKIGVQMSGINASGELFLEKGRHSIKICSKGIIYLSKIRIA